MSTIIFDIAAFRALFPAFADATKYPDATLQAFWDTGARFITNQYGGDWCGNQGLTLAQQTLALQYMAAHIVATMTAATAGDTPGFVTSASIDKVSVTNLAPPNPDQWSFWLNGTPYGTALLALLDVNSVGGFFYGAFPVAAAFRR